MNTIKKEIKQVRELQTRFFGSNKTKEIEFRLRQLKRLKNAIKRYEDQLLTALLIDLGKHYNEGYMTEIGYVYQSLDTAVKNLSTWAKAKVVKTPYYMKLGKSYVVPEPYGRVLIIGPFNYPVQLVIEPLIGAIAAGNCAVVKLSELTPNVSAVLEKMISDIFPRKYIWCLSGGVIETTALLEERFDYLFFTGSQRVGKIVMQAAAKNMTPLTLELGGKSPVIIDETANLSLAAQQVVWGKTLNAGQTCVAPDYIYIHESVKERFLKLVDKACVKQYGKAILQSPYYSKIINDIHFNRLIQIIQKEQDRILLGGNYTKQERKIEFTVIDAKNGTQPCMQEELFGPILPMITYTDLNMVIEEINQKPKPLALYLFSRNIRTQQRLIEHTSSGGVCINDVISHLVNPNLPFGGVGDSGFGAYHGKESFLRFSHEKSIYHNRCNISNLIAKPPYTRMQLWLVRRIMH